MSGSATFRLHVTTSLSRSGMKIFRVSLASAYRARAGPCFIALTFSEETWRAGRLAMWAAHIVAGRSRRHRPLSCAVQNRLCSACYGRSPYSSREDRCPRKYFRGAEGERETIAMIASTCSDRRPKYRARPGAQVPHFDRSTGRLIAANLDDGRNDNSNPAAIKPVRIGTAANSSISIMAYL
jgi:hypothetical protein